MTNLAADGNLTRRRAAAAVRNPLPAMATLSYSHKVWQWTVTNCPLCGQEHQHGGGSVTDDPTSLLGHRVAHCMNRTGDYLLVSIHSIGERERIIREARAGSEMEEKAPGVTAGENNKKAPPLPDSVLPANDGQPEARAQRMPEASPAIAAAAWIEGPGATGVAVKPLGAGLLDRVNAYLGKFVSYPSEHAQTAHALWIAHTHLMECWDSTPRIAFLSPEPGSGKTRALEISETLVPRPMESINATPAYIFRKVSDPEGAPTLLYDEIDTVFGPKAKDNEEIRGILNAGHRRGAKAGRCVVRGKSIETEELPAYCAVALAGLGVLPDTILTRSVIVRMRRRAPNETVEPYRRRVHAPEGEAIRTELAAWADTVRSSLTAVWPTMPAGIADRDADVWEALLAVADAAGGAWPKRARVAAVALVAAAKGGTPSLGVLLLTHLRLVFGDRQEMSSEEILKALMSLDEAPWADIKGKPIDARRLARMLEPYGVKSKNVRLADRVVKGYAKVDLHDPWSRYLRVADVAADAERQAS